MDLRKNQVFVRNLSFETNSNVMKVYCDECWNIHSNNFCFQDLLEIFQDVGPVKRASVAEENGTSKGYGFVKL